MWTKFLDFDFRNAFCLDLEEFGKLREAIAWLRIYGKVARHRLYFFRLIQSLNHLTFFAIYFGNFSVNSFIHQRNFAFLLHSCLRLLATIDSSIRLFPMKKSVATILAEFHHSSRYHFVTFLAILSLRFRIPLFKFNRTSIWVGVRCVMAAQGYLAHFRNLIASATFEEFEIVFWRFLFIFRDFTRFFSIV